MKTLRPLPSEVGALLVRGWKICWWRGKRDAGLEEAICQRIMARTGEPTWRVFATLDDIATEVTADADARLAWQNERQA